MAEKEYIEREALIDFCKRLYTTGGTKLPLPFLGHTHTQTSSMILIISPPQMLHP